MPTSLREGPRALLTALLAVLAVSLAAAPAAFARGSAPIVPDRQPGDLAGALSSSQAREAITDAAFDELPPTGTQTPVFDCSDGLDNDGDASFDGDDPQCSSAYDSREDVEVAPGVGSDDQIPAALGYTALGGFGGNLKDYAILSTGDALSANAPNQRQDLSVDLEGSGYADRDNGTDTIFDLTTLRIELDVPQGTSCLRFDYRFLTEEYPEYINRSVNDFFVAELDTSSFQGRNGREVLDPDNFAVDDRGQLISVDTAEFSAEDATGTTYDGGAEKLTASTPVTPGAHTLYLSIADQGDAVYDSSVLLDELRFTSSGGCAVPADAVAPETSIESGPESGDTTDDPTPTFTLAATEQDATFECSVDGAAFTDCDSPFTTGSLSDGDHSLRVRATDGAGNTDPTAAVSRFRVDTGSNPPFDEDPPTVTITSGPADGSTTDDRTPTFEFSSSEPGSTFQCYFGLTGEDPVDCESPYTTQPLDDGGYVLFVEATDRAGNVGRTQRGFFVGDGGPSGAPQTRITKGPKKVVKTRAKKAKVRFSFASDQAGSTFRCALDRGAFKTCRSPFSAALKPGRHSFSVFAAGPGGQIDPTPAKSSFKVVRKRR